MFYEFICEDDEDEKEGVLSTRCDHEKRLESMSDNIYSTMDCREDDNVKEEQHLEKRKKSSKILKKQALIVASYYNQDQNQIMDSYTIYGQNLLNLISKWTNLPKQFKMQQNSKQSNLKKVPANEKQNQQPSQP